jgi:hypothetical protein
LLPILFGIFLVLKAPHRFRVCFLRQYNASLIYL